MKKNWLTLTTLMALFCSGLGQAADHLDGPRASADPTADITDLFAWMSPDAKTVYLIMNVFPQATQASRFSNAVQYVFHVASRNNFGDPASNPVNIICTFDTSQKISCWAGDEYVNGDASNAAGLASGDGKLRVYAGLRDDPFFFNLDGFKHTADTVKAAASSLTFDPAGCPNLPPATAAALRNQLRSDANGGPAKDFFKNLNVLSLVLAVDKSVVAKGGSLVSVWASTNAR
ncbi:MAG TPA: DUF4331 family protein [Myxococcaceae bacterium]|nr:DUF4331 family protein [Myxococcaceae bacterium]